MQSEFPPYHPLVDPREGVEIFQREEDGGLLGGPLLEGRILFRQLRQDPFAGGRGD